MPVPQGPEGEGAAAEAIRAAETALARQNSVTAQVDLAVVTAVLNAHTAHTDGAAALDALQREIEAAVSTRTALDTPAGAREFQRYLIDKLGDIRSVVEETHLDDTSKASLAAALASLYASTGSGGGAEGPDSPATPAPPPRPAESTSASPASPGPGVAAGLDGGLDSGLSDFGPLPFPGPELEAGPPADMTGTPPPAVAAPTGQAPQVAPPMPSIPALPSLGGGPSGLGPLDGLGSLAALAGPPEPVSAPGDDAGGEPDEDPDDELPGPENEVPAAENQPSDQPFAGVIAAAVSGTPIAEAFDGQGITIPGPGTPVSAPLAPDGIVPGDVAMFADRHGLALGNGKVLLDDQIQPIETVNRPGFIGWQHPPEPDRTAEPDR